MRFVRVTCVLLATAICCNAAVIQEDTKFTNQQAVGTVDNTALAKNSSTPVVPDNASVTTANATRNINGATTLATATTVSTNGNGNKDNSASPANEQSTSTASSTTSSTTTVTAAPTTLSTTIKKTLIPENCTTADTITTTTTTTTTTITTPTTSNASNVLSTAAVPVSTKVAPPSSYKERHFDGLSFLGGIILATCLMAIGVLSWKSYKTFNEQNYRTL